jgi:hypothetical protein
MYPEWQITAASNLFVNKRAYQRLPEAEKGGAILTLCERLEHTAEQYAKELEAELEITD